MKYIAAFLNSEGGVLYIGIDDNSIVNGFEITQHEFDKFLLSIDKEGKFSLNPPLMPQKYAIKRIPVYHHHRNKDLWVI
jgi:predicted HTH transcriptional regulator